MSDDYNYILIDVDWRFPAPKARKRYVPVERAENAEAAIARVRELHHTTVDYVDGPDGPCDIEHCAECGYIPLDDGEMCPTIRAIEGLDLATEYRLRAEQAEATIWAVQEACKAKQGPRFHDDPYNRGWDNALAFVESKVALGECDE